MFEILKYYGIPGSGKTTNLLRIIEDAIKSGTDIKDICSVSFSCSAADEVITRMEEKGFISSYGRNKKDKNVPFYFGTIHAICKRMLGWEFSKKEGVMRLENDLDRYRFLRSKGLKYPVEKSQEPEDVPHIPFLSEDTSDMGDEEKLFEVRHYCNNHCIPLEHWRSSGIKFMSINANNVYPLCREWEDYKRKHGLVDYDDMLLEALKFKLIPFVSLLIIDEFQDMSPLLYKIVTSWMPHAEMVVVGGDDDQTIYIWNGADPNFLLNLPGHEEVLSLSHRVPSNILQKAQTLIETVSNRRFKEFHAKKIGGDFIRLHVPSISDITHYLHADKSVYFLFRTNRLAKYFCEQCLIPGGIPYSRLKTTKRRTIIPETWSYKMVYIRNIMVKIHLNQPLDTHEIKTLIKILPSCHKGKVDGFIRYGMRSRFKNEKEIKNWPIDVLLRDVFVKFPAWNDGLIVSHVGGSIQRNAYLKNVTMGYYNFSPWQIKVSTIHLAKGLQADIVFLFNNHPRKIQNEILVGGRPILDSEKRLYYTGITRALESLIFVDDFFDTFKFNLEV